jgi:hypothetical protein
MLQNDEGNRYFQTRGEICQDSGGEGTQERGGIAQKTHNRKFDRLRDTMDTSVLRRRHASGELEVDHTERE